MLRPDESPLGGAAVVEANPEVPAESAPSPATGLAASDGDEPMVLAGGSLEPFASLFGAVSPIDSLEQLAELRIGDLVMHHVKGASAPRSAEQIEQAAALQACFLVIHALLQYDMSVDEIQIVQFQTPEGQEDVTFGYRYHPTIQEYHQYLSLPIDSLLGMEQSKFYNFLETFLQEAVPNESQRYFLLKAARAWVNSGCGMPQPARAGSTLRDGVPPIGDLLIHFQVISPKELGQLLAMQACARALFFTECKQELSLTQFPHLDALLQQPLSPQDQVALPWQRAQRLLQVLCVSCALADDPWTKVPEGIKSELDVITNAYRLIYEGILAQLRNFAEHMPFIGQALPQPVQGLEPVDYSGIIENFARIVEFPAFQQLLGARGCMVWAPGAYGQGDSGLMLSILKADWPVVSAMVTAQHESVSQEAPRPG